MAMSLGEQVGRGHFTNSRHTRDYRWWVKRYHRRNYRRMLKKMLEDCPRYNSYSGWAD